MNLRKWWKEPTNEKWFGSYWKTTLYDATEEELKSCGITQKQAFLRFCACSTILVIGLILPPVFCVLGKLLDTLSYNVFNEHLFEGLSSKTALIVQYVGLGTMIVPGFIIYLWNAIAGLLGVWQFYDDTKCQELKATLEARRKETTRREEEERSKIRKEKQERQQEQDRKQEQQGRSKQDQEERWTGSTHTRKQPPTIDECYTILGIDKKTATRQKVQKAFKKLALQYHPDKNPNDPIAEKWFRVIKDAYEMLLVIHK